MAPTRKKLRIWLLTLLPVPLSKLVQAYVWLVFLTSKVEVKIDDDSFAILQSNQPFTLTLWHNRILLIPRYMQRYRFLAAVISTHADGDILARFLGNYGHSTIRGSSRRGAFGAVKGIISSLKNGVTVVITPDGPLGPRYEINSNMLNIAAKSKTSIMPVCYAAKRTLVLNSWDKFIIPYPFNHIIIEIMKPVFPSQDMPEQEQRKALQIAMNEQVKRLDNMFSH